MKDAVDVLNGRIAELKSENQRLRDALTGLMNLTATAYGHQVNEVPEYRKAKAVLEPSSMREPNALAEQESG